MQNNQQEQNNLQEPIQNQLLIDFSSPYLIQQKQSIQNESYKWQQSENHISQDIKLQKLFEVYDDQNVDSIEKNNKRIPQLPRLSLIEKLTIQNAYRKGDIQPMFINAKYQELRSVNLSDYRISILPQMNAPKLQELLVQNNYIASIDNFLKGNNPLLKRLEVNSNEIQEINIMQQKPQLETIKLSNNNLKTIPNHTFQQCINIKVLFLDRNSIRYLPQLNLSNLETLNLDCNKLQNISSLSKRQYPRLKKISLRLNFIKKLCKLNAPQLNSFIFKQNRISNVDNFMKSNLSQYIKIKAGYTVQFKIKEKILKKIGSKGIIQE